MRPHGLPGSSGHGILQARILAWVAVPFSRGSSQPRDRTLLTGTTQQTLNHSHSAKPLFNSCPEENLTYIFFYYAVRLGSKFLFIPQVCPTLWAPFIEQLSYLHWIALGPLSKISWSVGFTPGMPEYVNIRTSISVVHHSDRMKGKKMIIYTSHQYAQDEEKHLTNSSTFYD